MRKRKSVKCITCLEFFIITTIIQLLSLLLLLVVVVVVVAAGVAVAAAPHFVFVCNNIFYPSYLFLLLLK
jgi:hypothetical protein